MSLSPADQLEQYEELVERYANTLDLSSSEAIKAFQAEVEKTNVYDRHLEAGSRVLDIGSGVGLPGIPIAIRRPDIQITLGEIRKRRAAFLEIVVAKLGLDNATVYNGDVKNLRGTSFDGVIAQAVGSLTKVFSLSEHLLTDNWLLISRKGDRLMAELEALQKIASVREVKLEALDSDSTLVCVRGGTV